MNGRTSPYISQPPPIPSQTALDFLQQDPDRVLSVTYNQDMRSSELLDMTSKVC